MYYIVLSHFHMVTIIYWLVVLTILKNMSSSVGKDYPHILWKNKIHVPNHQPVYVTITFNNYI